jgi:RimJ/RimL family protein N-acetyltransferase
MPILETERLSLREITPDDAQFLVGMLTDPDWLRFIGDRHVRTLEQARAYIQRIFVAAYEHVGHGLWLIERRADGRSLGICGLIAREGLSDVDLGFALMPAFRRKGYAHEAALGCLAYAKDVLGLRRVVAITSIDNRASAALLLRLGFSHESSVRLPGDDEDLRLFAIELSHRHPPFRG